MRAFEYAVITILVGALAILISTTVSGAIKASLDRSTQIIKEARQ